MAEQMPAVSASEMLSVNGVGMRLERFGKELAALIRALYVDGDDEE